MKLFYLFILFSVFMSCSSTQKKYKGDDPRSLIGKWEIVEVHYNEDVYFDTTDGTHTEDEVNGMKNTWISFEDRQKVSASVWIKDRDQPNTSVSNGIYEVDVETQRVRIEIPQDEPNFHAGSFFWKIKNDQLYLYSTNTKGEYKVYHRSE
jgi:hypothetical protein